ncbi:MAG: hypothetical protein KKF44_00210 [Nanoarchaeota archaeon]|nr:hypothetical protein [Nanoarchaeota archaeon]
MKSKRAMDMPTNTIVAWAIGLFVLIISMFLLMNKGQFFTSTTESCETQNGVCVAAENLNEDCSLAKFRWAPGTDCEDRVGEGAKCCVQMIK